MNKAVTGIRMEPMLIAQCRGLAAEKDMKLSEWVRMILRREVSRIRRGKR